MTYEKYRETIINSFRNNGGVQLSFAGSGKEIRAADDGSLYTQEWVRSWFGFKSGYETTSLSDEEFEELIKLDFDRCAEYHNAKNAASDGAQKALERLK